MPAAMEPPIVLSRQEQAFLLSALESGLRVATLRQLFLWSQGEMQALLPHAVLACLQFGPGGALQRLECLHGAGLAADAQALLAGRHVGLAVRIGRHCLLGGRLPALPEQLPGFQADLERAGFGNVLVHGTGQTAAGASVFILFGLPGRPSARHAYFLECLLPHLHLALGRLPAPRDADTAMPARPLSARETEIIGWLRAGKSNDEMGRILGISALTVKNHLQRIYRTLGVSNRAHALARCMELQLLQFEASPHGR